jgi:diguanylate cyclase (GGDEF)-like protein
MRSERIFRAAPRQHGGPGFTRTGDRRRLLAVALLLGAGIALLRLLDQQPRDATTVLFVVPIALCALRFGLRGGLGSAALSLAAVLALIPLAGDRLTFVAVATRASAFFLVGAIVGHFADGRDELEGDITLRKEAEDSIRLLLEQLAIIQRAIAERSPLDAILDAVVHAASRVIGSEIVGLRLIDENDPSYVTLSASTGVDLAMSHALRRAPVSEGIGGRAISEERVVTTNDYGSGEGDIPVLREKGLRAAMAAPVYGHGSCVGSVVVATRSERPFTAADAETLAFFAEYAGVAIATARAADAVRQALTDPLTGLPNRALFVDRLDHAMVRAERDGQAVAVLFLDVDDFKLVNDSLGHHAGDRLLVEVARRIRGCVRRSDTAARLGGDEFAILLANEGAEADSQLLAGRIVEALSAPFSLDAHELHVHASIGIASGSAGGEDLLRDADIAMYGAKSGKRGGICVFEPSMQEAAVRDLELRNELLHAVAREEITVSYQPIVSLADGRIVAFEALARWTHATLGPISPEQFIPLAESAGVIEELGSSVLRRACADVAAWRSGHADHAQLQVAVNVSAHQLGPQLRREAERVLALNGLPAGALVLEITETSLLHDPAAAIVQLRELRDLGIQIAIDDFGTGYSSLSYLRSFPVDALKIAKPFVDGIADEGGHEWAFARLITDLARTLGIVTVAEGIEAAAQHSRLADLGCDYGQGYLYSHAVPAAEVEALLRGGDEQQASHAA